MRHRILDAWTLLDPALEGQDFKKTRRGQDEGEDLQYSSKDIGPEGSRQSPEARYISTKYTKGRFSSQEFDNLQDYDNCNPHPSQPYASDNEPAVEQTPEHIQQFMDARARRQGSKEDTERFTSAILGKGLRFDTTKNSKKQHHDGAKHER
jgi:hypothetical protein